jgi:small subunit ribosomal protein S27e
LSSEWRRLIPQPKSKFQLVECAGCGNSQIIFSHTSKIVKCKVCEEEIASPTGGKAKILGRVLSEYG